MGLLIKKGDEYIETNQANLYQWEANLGIL